MLDIMKKRRGQVFSFSSNIPSALQLQISLYTYELEVSANKTQFESD